MIRIFFMLILSLMTLKAFADENHTQTINNEEITADTIAGLQKCWQYRVLGVCVWQQPDGQQTTTNYVSEYLPDVVVSVFNEAENSHPDNDKPDNNAWLEAQQLFDEAGSAAQKLIVNGMTHDDVGEGQHSVSDVHEQGVYFKEADVIGNPALAILSDHLPEVSLDSTATPMMPYYQSLLDSLLWRSLNLESSGAEKLYAISPTGGLLHHVGSFQSLTDWGGVYPHEGKIISTNDAKAAAVIAQRAADIITSDNAFALSHIHQSLSNDCGDHCTAAPIQENSDKTQFQMIYPDESDSCDWFGKTASYGKEAEQHTNGRYVWIIWRYYEGCVQTSGTVIAVTKALEKQEGNS